MPKYLVISYDNDEQQTFYDHVMASSEEEAMQQINDVRDYAIAVCGILANQLHQMAEVLDAATPEVIAGDLYNIAEETGLLDEEACAPLEIEPDESKPGWHRTPEGLVYKSEPTPA